MDQPERIETELFSQIVAAAEELYDRRLPYHNFEHALTVQRQAEEIIRHCREEKVLIDADVIRYAALFHDAGYSDDHRALGFDSKEAYAAALASQTLQQFGVADDIISRVQETIMATHRDAAFTTNEQKAVRAADLANMAGPYEEFVEANRRLKAEAELLTGNTISWVEWKAGTEKTVAWYLGQDIRLTSHHDDEHGHSAFHRRVQENLQRFLADHELEKIN